MRCEEERMEGEEKSRSESASKSGASGEGAEKSEERRTTEARFGGRHSTTLGTKPSIRLLVKRK